ncbi:MAG: hypothetical protein HKN59_05455 [Gammaproteobacteria bacterium]|nr:hypothetical protein [Gammaproteobacteria bacterium]
MAVLLTGCSALASRAASNLADDLGSAILNQDDPEIVRDGAPAYLLLIDSFAQGDDASGAMLETAASLYTAYAAVFVDDTLREKRLSGRARRYGERALCLRHLPEGADDSKQCGWSRLNFDDLSAELEQLQKSDAPALFAFTASWLVWIRAHSDDWTALADLPKVELLLERLRAVDAGYQPGNVHLYLGILHTLRPPALGGKPDTGREHFEQAIAISGGHDLGAKVEFARSYARLRYDRPLHDRLLNEVIQADPRHDGYTLLNVLAQREAENLLAGADEYF